METLVKDIDSLKGSLEDNLCKNELINSIFLDIFDRLASMFPTERGNEKYTNLTEEKVSKMLKTVYSCTDFQQMDDVFVIIEALIASLNNKPTEQIVQ